MSEKLLVCDALDERDFLRKKITRAITEAKFIGSKRIRDKKVGAIPEEVFKNSAEADYQSIVDSINRYQRIDVAITLANAKTEVTTRSGKTMTRAAAIALRKSLRGNTFSSTGVDFDGVLLNQMERQYAEAVEAVNSYNKKASMEAEGYKSNLTGRDGTKKLSDDEIATVEKLTADLNGELVDPLGLKEKIDKLADEHDKLVKELDTAIKISNATTYIEF